MWAGMVLHTLGRQRQVDSSDFQASRLYIVKLCQRKKGLLNKGGLTIKQSCHNSVHLYTAQFHTAPQK